MNSEYRDIIEELLKRSSANVEEEIRKNSPYSSKINKYISSVKELEYYQQLGLREQYVIRQSLIQPAINLTDTDIHGKSNYERMIYGNPPIAGSNGDFYTLHHMKQEYLGPFAELTSKQHSRPSNGARLHPKSSKEESWRSDERRKRLFQAQRVEHWTARLRTIRGAFKVKGAGEASIVKYAVPIPEEIVELQPHTEEYYFGEITQLFSTQLILPSKPALRTAEAAINTAFGPALEKTLLTVGSLLGDCFETFGISAENAEESVLVQRTLGWRFISRKLEHLIVICEQDDNYIYCCDAKDNMYVYSAWEDTVEDLHQMFLPFLVSEGKFGCSLLLTVMEYRGNN